MNLQITRGLLLLGALGVTTVAYSAWQEPTPSVVSGHVGLPYCQTPVSARSETAEPADQNLVLFLYSLAQGTASASQ
ncbi:hypothetical protein IQ22_00207 [Pseudomonas duriflava]|uniref:Uncharacterized protein n=1 Tax=Pseudomonas duriflava TaxID=459528 RepID=A0A562QP16_9PSED|nr:hypothetical protein IQ22_00207 [Pseudomonas duriflava]